MPKHRRVSDGPTAPPRCARHLPFARGGLDFAQPKASPSQGADSPCQGEMSRRDKGGRDGGPKGRRDRRRRSQRLLRHVALIPSSDCSRRTWNCPSTCRRRSRTSRSRTDGGSRNCSRTRRSCRWKYRRRSRTNRTNSDTCRCTCSSGLSSTCRRQNRTTACSRGCSRGCSSAAAQNRGKRCHYSCCRKNTYEKPPEKISGSGCSRSILWRRCADGVRLCRFLPRPAVPAGPARAADGCLASAPAS